MLLVQALLKLTKPRRKNPSLNWTLRSFFSRPFVFYFSSRPSNYDKNYDYRRLSIVNFQSVISNEQAVCYE